MMGIPEDRHLLEVHIPRLSTSPYSMRRSTLGEIPLCHPLARDCSPWPDMCEFSSHFGYRLRLNVGHIQIPSHPATRGHGSSRVEWRRSERGEEKRQNRQRRVFWVLVRLLQSHADACRLRWQTQQRMRQQLDGAWCVREFLHSSAGRPSLALRLRSQAYHRNAPHSEECNPSSQQAIHL
jgi:hypothetical protein